MLLPQTLYKLYNTINRSDYGTARMIDLLKEINHNTIIIQSKITLRAPFLPKHVFLAAREAK